MNSLRHLLLVVVLVFAQWAAAMHSVEHATVHKDAPPHTCTLCLLSHDLGSALPSVAALPLSVALPFVPEALASAGRSAFPPPLAVQRGPPLA